MLTRDETIDLYLRDKLSEDDRNTFEILMLENKHIFDSVRERELLISSLKEEKDLFRSSTELGEIDTNNLMGPLNFWAWCKLQYSVAALTSISTLIVGVVALFLSNYSSMPEIETETPIIIEYVGIARSQEERQTLPNSFPITVDFDSTNLDEATVFRITIVNDQTSTEIFNRSDVVAHADGSVRINFNSKITGNFTVELNYTAQNVPAPPLRYLIYFPE